MSSITKRALAASFIKLLSQQSLNKITVKDIVEDAQVNRQTFYYHFHDIYDLIRWIFEQESEAAASGDNPDDWDCVLRKVLETMVRERPLVLNIIHSLNREHLEQYMSEVIDTLIWAKLEPLEEKLNCVEADKKFIADFYKYAFLGILIDWVCRGMREEPQSISEHLMRLLDGGLRQAMEQFSV